MASQILYLIYNTLWSNPKQPSFKTIPPSPYPRRLLWKKMWNPRWWPRNACDDRIITIHVLRRVDSSGQFKWLQHSSDDLDHFKVCWLTVPLRGLGIWNHWEWSRPRHLYINSLRRVLPFKMGGMRFLSHGSNLTQHYQIIMNLHLRG